MQMIFTMSIARPWMGRSSIVTESLHLGIELFRVSLAQWVQMLFFEVWHWGNYRLGCLKVHEAEHHTCKEEVAQTMCCSISIFGRNPSPLRMFGELEFEAEGFGNWRPYGHCHGYQGPPNEVGSFVRHEPFETLANIPSPSREKKSILNLEHLFFGNSMAVSWGSCGQKIKWVWLKCVHFGRPKNTHTIATWCCSTASKGRANGLETRPKTVCKPCKYAVGYFPKYTVSRFLDYGR